MSGGYGGGAGGPSLPLLADWQDLALAAGVGPIPWTLEPGTDAAWLQDVNGSPLAPVDGWYIYTGFASGAAAAGVSWVGFGIDGPASWMAFQDVQLIVGGNSTHATLTALVHMLAGDPFMFNYNLYDAAGGGAVGTIVGAAGLSIVLLVAG